MSRKDTIIFAAIINIGLLVFLFATAMRTNEEETVVAVQEVPELKIQPQNTIARDIPMRKQVEVKDDVDYLLSQLPQKNYQTPLAPSVPEVSSKEEVATQVASIKKDESELQTTPTIKHSSSPQVHYVEISVKRGDVLERIARANGITVEELMEINNLPDTRLQIGQLLKVPLKPVLASSMKASKEESSATSDNYYVVRSGDNPWTIAMRHRMNLDDLLRLNELDEEKARRLKPGDRLRVR
jgi:peptidoglycan endopeptidase LytF